MEIYSNTTRFALACNTSSKIIEPIQSRCAIVRYSKLGEKDILERLLHVCQQEKVCHTSPASQARNPACLIGATPDTAENDHLRVLKQAPALSGRVYSAEGDYACAHVLLPKGQLCKCVVSVSSICVGLGVTAAFHPKEAAMIGADPICRPSASFTCKHDKLAWAMSVAGAIREGGLGSHHLHSRRRHAPGPQQPAGHPLWLWPGRLGRCLQGEKQLPSGVSAF